LRGLEEGAGSEWGTRPPHASETVTEQIGRLVAHGNRIVLETGSTTVELSALEVFRAAIRGAPEVRGFRLAPVSSSCPGITFHGQPELVSVLVQGDAHLTACAAVHTHGGVIEVDPASDQLLVGQHWYPLEPETAGAAGTWLRAHTHESRLSPEAYLDLYRGRDLGFDVLDMVDDEALIRLTTALPRPLGLSTRLYPYQELGAGWLRARADHRIGGILGDEMGLGKTIQLIALVADRLLRGHAPCLIVVPLTIMESWRREFAKFAPAVDVYRHQGADRTRRPVLLRAQQVVLTTYDIAVIDEPVLSMVDWDIVILDEAQAIKNPDTQRARAVKGLPRASGFASTGTPLENRTQDVWSLVDFAVPGYLGDRAVFAERFEDDPSGLRHALRPVMLRREVAAVADDLPERVDVDVPLEMLEPEATGYAALIGGVAGERAGSLLALITRLRQYTAHRDALEGRRPHPAERSAKMMRLVEIADEIVLSGDKAIIFVAFLEVADIIRDVLTGTLGVAAWTIDGRTPPHDRQRIIDVFSTTPGPAFLVLNPAAAGVGLNIQAATHVIHYTLEWNPAREAQATARAWRRGQERPVTVHRLFYAGTIDEAIIERLEEKRDLFDEVIVPTREEDITLKALLERALEISSSSR
jgi:SNF2 family DNA or RNA helicase